MARCFRLSSLCPVAKFGRVTLPMMRTTTILGSLFGLLSQAVALDLSKAIIVSAANPTVSEKKAVLMLVEEVEKRTQIRWATQSTWPDSAAAVIALGKAATD